MSSKKYVINGKFMSDRMQGIVRYAREMTKALDKCISEVKEIEIKLVVPCNSFDIPEYENIEVVQIGKKTGIKWEQTDLKKYIKQNKGYTCINFCNVKPIGISAGITTIHDIMYKTKPEYYKTFRNKLSRLWHIWQYSYICKHEKIILTDSEYSKKEIEEYYPKSKGKVKVIPCGWQHVLDYKESDDWETRYPFLEKKKFYFSLSTLAKNKNGQWIISVACNNPDSVFAIAGKYYETDKVEIPSNVHMLGFISDEDACSLIKNCKAFIHPSLYEGFGLPPLEALALGTEVISSMATSLPEVLGESVYYIDSNNYDIDVDSIMSCNIEKPESVLSKYNWNKSAYLLANIMKEMC